MQVKSKTGTYGKQVIVTLQHAEELIPIMQQQTPKDMILEMKRKGLEPVSSPKTRVEDAFWVDEETGVTHPIKYFFCWCDYRLGITDGRTEG
jgi:hypothetical protein